MSRTRSYNCSKHFSGFGIKGDNLTEEQYAKCLICTRQTDFESGNNIETETDEGHTGGANLNMGKYRKSAESAPSWIDKFRFKEGLEEYFLMLLGTVLKNPASSRFDFGTDPKVNHFYFLLPPDNAKECPEVTIYNGYAQTTDDARAFNNALLSEFKVTANRDDAPTLETTYVSDYNNFNLANPTRNYLIKSLFVKSSQVNIYYGDPELSLEELMQKKLGCFTESSFDINKNMESVNCQDNKFGTTLKEEGTIETSGSIKVPWNDKTRKLEPEYEGGNVKAHSVSEETIEKQVLYEFLAGKIEGTDIDYRVMIHFPLITLTNVESPLSGDDVKDLTIEYEVPTKPDFSFMYVDIWTDLDELRVDNEGVNLDDLFYVEPVTPAPVPNNYDLTFVVTDGTDPVDGATISIGSLTGTTDSSGNATIQNVPEGSNEVTVSKDGFTTHTETITVESSTTMNVTLTAS